jgi:hypothetical protein
MSKGKYHLARKAGIGVGHPDFYTRCQVCGKPSTESNPFYAYSAGQYHKKCYQVLFDICEQCGTSTMSVPHNEHYHSEKLCDKCYNENHGLTVVALIFGPF